MAQSPAELSHI